MADGVHQERMRIEPMQSMENPTDAGTARVDRGLMTYTGLQVFTKLERKEHVFTAMATLNFVCSCP